MYCGGHFLNEKTLKKFYKERKGNNECIVEDISLMKKHLNSFIKKEKVVKYFQIIRKIGTRKM